MGGHSNGFTGSGEVDSGQDTKVRIFWSTNHHSKPFLWCESYHQHYNYMISQQMSGLANKFKMSPGRGAPLVSCLHHFFMNAKTTLHWEDLFHWAHRFLQVGTPAVCDPGGPGGGLKIEPMDTSSTDPSPESLNRDGLQVILIMQWFFLNRADTRVVADVLFWPSVEFLV